MAGIVKRNGKGVEYAGGPGAGTGLETETETEVRNGPEPRGWLTNVRLDDVLGGP